MFTLFEDLNKKDLEFLLTYKLCQDFLGTFFGAISREGFNNNPNCLQFKTAYRQLLLRHEIKELDNGNCSFDGVQILHTSSKSVDNSSEVNTDVEINPEEIDEDIILSTFYELTHYVEGVVDYIAGFVAKKLKTKFKCHICIQNLEGSDEEMPLLTKIKKQRFPKNAINGCCIYLQNRRKIYQAPRYKKNYMHNIMTTKIFNVVENSVFLADTKEKHRDN
jgi:hypothetical protein